MNISNKILKMSGVFLFSFLTNPGYTMEDPRESAFHACTCVLSSIQESGEGELSDLITTLKNDLNKPEYADFLNHSGFYNICATKTLELINNDVPSHEIYQFIAPFLQYHQKRGKARMILPTGETFFIPSAIKKLKEAGLYRKKMENSEIVAALGEKEIPILITHNTNPDKEEWGVINLNHSSFDDVRAEAGLLRALRSFVGNYKEQFKPKGSILGGSDYNVAVFLLRAFAQ